MARRSGSSGADRVGYCCPPKKHQFKPGQSGNPRGRPKGAKNEATILRQIFNKRLTVREGSNSRKVSVLEAILLRAVEDALKGDHKAAVFILNRHKLSEDSAPDQEGLTQDDKALLNEYIKRIETDLRKKTA